MLPGRWGIRGVIGTNAIVFTTADAAPLLWLNACAWSSGGVRNPV